MAYGHVSVDPRGPIAHDKLSHDVIQLGNAWLVLTCSDRSRPCPLSSPKLYPTASICTYVNMMPVAFARIPQAVRAPLFRPRAGFQPSGRGWGSTPRLPSNIRFSSSIQSGHIKLADDEGIIYVNSECFSYQHPRGYSLPNHIQTSSHIGSNGYYGGHSVISNPSKEF